MTAVPIAAPLFQAGRLVLALGRPVPRRPDLDDLFIRSVKDAFPIVANHQYLAPDAPLQVPHMVLQSSASRLAVSSVGAELEVRFYGDFATDYGQCRSYLQSKATAIVNGWTSAAEELPAFVGVVLTSALSFKEAGIHPVEHLLQRHVRAELGDPKVAQDAGAKVAVRVNDAYFATVNLTNYESKVVERPLFGGGQVVQVKPWEGTVTDLGISAELDVNNRLKAVREHSDPKVNVDEIEAILRVLDELVAQLPEYVATGSLKVPTLAQGQAT